MSTASGHIDKKQPNKQPWAATGKAGIPSLA